MVSRTLRVGFGASSRVKTLQASRILVPARILDAKLTYTPASGSHNYSLSASAISVPVTVQAANLSYSSGGAPGIPQNVTLVQQAGTSNSTTPVSNSQKIQWDSVSGATSYNVYRNGSLYAQPGNVTSYTDSAATNSNVLTYDAPATAYYYQVSGVNGSGEGIKSTQYLCYEYQNGSSTCGQSIFNY